MTDDDLKCMIERATFLSSAVKKLTFREVEFEELLRHFLREGTGGREESVGRPASEAAQPRRRGQPSGVAGCLATLAGAGFFKMPKRISDVQEELRRHGH